MTNAYIVILYIETEPDTYSIFSVSNDAFEDFKDAQSIAIEEMKKIPGYSRVTNGWYQHKAGYEMESMSMEFEVNNTTHQDTACLRRGKVVLRKLTIHPFDH